MALQCPDCNKVFAKNADDQPDQLVYLLARCAACMGKFYGNEWLKEMNV